MTKLRITITFFTPAKLEPEKQWDPDPPVLLHFHECCYSNRNIWTIWMFPRFSF